MSCVERDYDPELSTTLLIAEVRELLGSQRRAERLICRYLADMADRIRDRKSWELAVYTDEYHASRSYFGLGGRDTRERVRIGHALRSLPQIDRAFSDGELSYSRVREVTRIATALTEPIWLELARTLDMRTLERRVAGARAHSQRAGTAARPMPEPLAPETVCATSQPPASMREAGGVPDRQGDPLDSARPDRGGKAEPIQHVGPESGRPPGKDADKGRKMPSQFGAVEPPERASHAEISPEMHAEGVELRPESPAEAENIERRPESPAEAENIERRAELPLCFQPTGASTRSVTLELTTETWEILQRALSGVRRASSAAMSTDEALRAVARAALAAQANAADAASTRSSPAPTEPTASDSACSWNQPPPSAVATAGPRSCCEYDAEPSATQMGSTAEGPSSELQAPSRSASSFRRVASRATPEAPCNERSVTHVGSTTQVGSSVEGAAPEEKAAGCAADGSTLVASRAKPGAYCLERSTTQGGSSLQSAAPEVRVANRAGELFELVASRAKPEAYCRERSTPPARPSEEGAPDEVKAPGCAEEWSELVTSHAEAQAHRSEKSTTPVGSSLEGPPDEVVALRTKLGAYCRGKGTTRVGSSVEGAPPELKATACAEKGSDPVASCANPGAYCRERCTIPVGSSVGGAPSEAKAPGCTGKWSGPLVPRAEPETHCSERSATQVGMSLEAPGPSPRRLVEEFEQPSGLTLSVLDVESATSSRLLAVMRRREGAWGLDELVESSGLLVQQVLAELTLLELAGRVRWRASGLEPV
jgi:DprA/Smf-like nucleotide binding protein involved in DNA uptake